MCTFLNTGGNDLRNDVKFSTALSNDVKYLQVVVKMTLSTSTALRNDVQCCFDVTDVSNLSQVEVYTRIVAKRHDADVSGSLCHVKLVNDIL